MGRPQRLRPSGESRKSGAFRFEFLILLIAAALFLPNIVSPPYLLDDVDAVQAQIARNMLDSGDWVTARLDGVPYLEKSPFKYWSIAVSYALFGVHDWSARIPIALTSIALCWLTFRMGAWAFSARAGFYGGLALATSIGLFLFTRFLIPDVMLTLAIALALWGFARSLDEDEPHPRRWSAVMAASIGTGLLIKGLISAVFPIGAALVYLAVTRQLFLRRTWHRLTVVRGTLLALLIAAPWHVLATIKNPPFFYWGFHSVPGEYHGFFWFYFINEHVLRFLNLRYPRDYNTVPLWEFWALHLVWFFPWSVFLGGLFRLSYRPQDRGGGLRLLALCWIGVVMLFFSFSSTQEYYSMPVYPALALLLGCAMAEDWRRDIRYAQFALAGISVLAALAIAFILVKVWTVPAPGDIAHALVQHPENYTLSMGHLSDLTLGAFAYLRSPLVLAGLAFLLGAVGLLLWRRRGGYFVTAAMMLLALNAAQRARAVFDPYLSSKALADALLHAPPGQLIEDNAYYTFSSVFFYANRTALLLDGRKTNLEYGSYAPGAPEVFIDEGRFVDLWRRPDRAYLLIERERLPRIVRQVGQAALHPVAETGGRYLFTNHAGLD